MTEQKIAVALSGGVDSAVAAALLKAQGHKLLGVTLLLAEESSHAQDAANVAAVLGIDHNIIDLRENFHALVIKPFIEAYASGLTPNPCVNCNEKIKFGALWHIAQELGCNAMASGHYARIVEKDGRRCLCRAANKQKDQSYVLYRINSEVLHHLYLPLGDYDKSAVRALAAEFNLPVAQKAESQEICFIPDDDYHAFLKAHCPSCLVPGHIVSRTGKILGTHQGLPLYTIGQRKGLGIAAGKPLYVIELDTVKNNVVVGDNDDVFSDVLTAKNLCWLEHKLGMKDDNTREVIAKIRYGHKGERATVRLDKSGCATVKFISPVRAVTKGQSVVFYDLSGEIVIGGGIIC